jgi:hypothetical protein
VDHTWPVHCTDRSASTIQSWEDTMDVGMILILANSLMAGFIYVVIGMIWPE